MAFTATITRVERADRTLNVEVRYADSATSFEALHVLNFNDADILTVAQARNEIVRVGNQYKGTVDAIFNRFAAFVGTVITI